MTRHVLRAGKDRLPRRPESRRCRDAQVVRGLEGCQDGYLYNGGAATMFGIGQGQYLSVSPLQLAVAYAAVANGGTVFHPRVAKAIVSQNGKLVQKIGPSVANKLPVSPEVLQYTRDAMLDVTRSGTASGAFAGFPLDAIPIAGKTGTAEVPGHNDTSWFGSFSSQYVVVIEIPDTGQGALFAAPVARQVYEGIYGINQPALLPDSARRAAEGHRAVTSLLPGTRPPRRVTRGPVTLEPLAGPGAATSRARERRSLSLRNVDWLLAGSCFRCASSARC